MQWALSEMELNASCDDVFDDAFERFKFPVKHLNDVPVKLV